MAFSLPCRFCFSRLGLVSEREVITIRPKLPAVRIRLSIPGRRIEVLHISCLVASIRRALEEQKYARCHKKSHPATFAMLLSERGNYFEMVTASEPDTRGETRRERAKTCYSRIANLDSTASGESMKSGRIAGCPMSYTKGAIVGSIARRDDLPSGAR